MTGVPATSHSLQGTDAFPAGWYPDQGGYLGWTFDPLYINSAFAPSAGFPFFYAVAIPNTITVANVWYDVSTAGTGVQLPVNVFFGVYDSTGQRRGVTAAQDTIVQTAGIKTSALVLDGGQSFTFAGSPGAFMWIGFLIGTQSTTNLQLGSPTSTAFTATAINGGLTAANFRVGRLAGAQTALPASFTPSTLAQPSSVQAWAALT